MLSYSGNHQREGHHFYLNVSLVISLHNVFICCYGAEADEYLYSGDIFLAGVLYCVTARHITLQWHELWTWSTEYWLLREPRVSPDPGTRRGQCSGHRRGGGWWWGEWRPSQCVWPSSSVTVSPALLGCELWGVSLYSDPILPGEHCYHGVCFMWVWHSQHVLKTMIISKNTE